MSSPILSIIIPAYNEEHHVRQLLQCLSDQDFDMSLVEIVVVNNNSLDATVSVVQEFIQKHSHLNIPLLNEKTQGLSITRNTGARYASGSILVFLDADNIVGKSFIRDVYVEFYEKGFEAGTIHTQVSGSWFGELVFHSLEMIKVIFKRPFGKSFCSKRLFKLTGGFNTNIGMAGTNLDFLCRVKGCLKKEGKRLGHIKSPIFTSLRRFQENGYYSVLSKWFLAYIGFNHISYNLK